MALGGAEWMQFEMVATVSYGICWDGMRWALQTQTQTQRWNNQCAWIEPPNIYLPFHLPGFENIKNSPSVYRKSSSALRVHNCPEISLHSKGEASVWGPPHLSRLGSSGCERILKPHALAGIVTWVRTSIIIVKPCLLGTSSMGRCWFNIIGSFNVKGRYTENR